jgi:hypothetical protein
MTTIKEHCCGADKLFDAKTAKKQYKSYLKRRTLTSDQKTHWPIRKNPHWGIVA